MPRILPVRPETADPKTAELLSDLKQRTGMVPNLVSTMAQSPTVATAYLGFSQALAGGRLPAPLREQISLAVGQANDCGYCVAAHCALGQKAGLSLEDVAQARHATATGDKSGVALAFARQLVDGRGRVADADIDGLRKAGYDDGEIGEIVANVALNIFTNYFNHVAGTEIDFPAAPKL